MCKIQIERRITMAGRKPKESIPKKKCQGECKKERSHTLFFKTTSPLFPDGMINICRDCVRKEVDIEDVNSVIKFLRQIDKPYVEKYWKTAYSNKEKAHPLGAYMRMVNGLNNGMEKTFDDTKSMPTNSDALLAPKEVNSDTIQNIKGEVIEFSDELLEKWGAGYSKSEYLKMEKFYQDMRVTHEIHTPVHVNKLMELAYLTIEQERLRRERDIPNYTKLAAAIDKMESSAGFSPKDRQSIDDATGIRSFSQVFEQVEKKGFRKPPPLTYEEDIYDKSIVSLANYYHRIIGMQILAELPEEMKDEIYDFYELDETPVDIDDEEYEDLDFTVDDEDE